MSINRTEATRLARICLPKILANSPTSHDDYCLDGGDDDDAAKTTATPSSSLFLAEEHVSVKSLCRLWAGMGCIYQVTIAMPSSSSSSSSSPNKKTKQGKCKNTIFHHHHFIIKHIVIPPPPSRSQRSAVGDERKAHSYFIEANFYRNLAPLLIEKYDLAIPIPYHVELLDNTTTNHEARDDYNRSQTQVTADDATKKDPTIITICMSLLDGSSNSKNNDTQTIGTSSSGIHAALSWLATLHAATWGDVKDLDAHVAARTIHPIGSYWHLDTRNEEHENMSDRGWEGRLKRAARAIHERLRRDAMQCCIHGDAKDANMLFAKKVAGGDDDDGGGGDVSVSMYDFQYCGKAPPSVDLAYYLCVAVGDINSEYIQYYYQQLTCKLKNEGIQHLPTLKELEESISLALCDFQRFMCGWGQWGSDISDTVIAVLDRLDDGNILETEDDYREAMMREYG